MRLDTVETDVLKRRDTAGIWHEVGVASCEDCGCPYHYSLDEVGLIWEAGETFAADCQDPTCGCHSRPVQGMRFQLHFR